MTEIVLLTGDQPKAECPKCGEVLQGIDYGHFRHLMDIHLSIHAEHKRKTHEAELDKVRIAAKRAAVLTESRATNS